MRPQDVAGRSFQRALWGYRPREVRAFLDQVAFELERRDRRIAELESAPPPVIQEGPVEATLAALRADLQALMSAVAAQRAPAGEPSVVGAAGRVIAEERGGSGGR